MVQCITQLGFTVVMWLHSDCYCQLQVAEVWIYPLPTSDVVCSHDLSQAEKWGLVNIRQYIRTSLRWWASNVTQLCNNWRRGLPIHRSWEKL